MKRVLILAPHEDFHAIAIQSLLKSRHNCASDIVDTGLFPVSLKLAQWSGLSTCVEMNGHPLDSYRSIWWRRPNVPALASEIKSNPEEVKFASRECREVLWGILHASGLRIYNRPEMEAVAVYKPYQLRIAQSCGLNVPETLVTNDKEKVLAFRSEHPRLVYKAHSATQIKMTETRFLKDEDLDDLWRLQYAPVIFQRYIERGREFRVTVVKEQVFAVEVMIQHPHAEIDWRLDPSYRLQSVALSRELEDQLLSLCRVLGLDSGSIDLRQDPSGKIYFLEINPSGQFLFLDIFGETHIAEAFCNMLVS